MPTHSQGCRQRGTVGRVSSRGSWAMGKGEPLAAHPLAAEQRRQAHQRDDHGQDEAAPAKHWEKPRPPRNARGAVEHAGEEIGRPRRHPGRDEVQERGPAVLRRCVEQGVGHDREYRLEEDVAGQAGGGSDHRVDGEDASARSGGLGPGAPADRVGGEHHEKQKQRGHHQRPGGDEHPAGQLAAHHPGDDRHLGEHANDDGAQGNTLHGRWVSLPVTTFL